MLDFTSLKNIMKNHQLLLFLFFCVIVLSIQHTSGTPVKTSNIVNRNYCRNHIFSPRCRGQQKRDLTSRLNDDYRSPTMDDYSGLEHSREVALVLSSPTVFGEMLRKVIEASPELELESNYLK